MARLLGRQETISDGDWLKQVLPLYEAIKPSLAAFEEAAEAAEHEVASILLRKVGQEYRVRWEVEKCAAAAKALPQPTSPHARKAKKNLDEALRDFLRAAKQVETLAYDLGGSFGHEAQRGTGIRRRVAQHSLNATATAVYWRCRTGKRRLAEFSTYLDQFE